jgi:GntR family transcriptional regulator
MAGNPRWLEIAEDLQERIEQDEFPRDGDGGRQQLPKELDLRGEYNASRNTVREALSYLAERGIVESEQGKGTFVIPRPAPFHVTLSAQGGAGGGEGAAYRLEAQVQNRQPTDSEVKVEIQPAIQKVARYLQVPPGSQVISRHQERFIDSSPWSLQTSFYPLDFVHRGALRLLETDDIEEGTVKYLEEALGYKQAGYHDEIRARNPDPDEIAFFNLPERAAVLVYETYRTAYDRDGNPFRVTVTVWPSDRNRLHYNIGLVPEPVIEKPGEPHGVDDAP